MTENTPDTVAYLALGLAAASGVFLAFLGSMVARYRNLQKDVQVLEQLEDNAG